MNNYFVLCVSDTEGFAFFLDANGEVYVGRKTFYPLNFFLECFRRMPKGTKLLLSGHDIHSIFSKARQELKYFRENGIIDPNKLATKSC